MRRCTILNIIVKNSTWFSFDSWESGAIFSAIIFIIFSIFSSHHIPYPQSLLMYVGISFNRYFSQMALLPLCEKWHHHKTTYLGSNEAHHVYNGSLKGCIMVSGFLKTLRPCLLMIRILFQFRASLDPSGFVCVFPWFCWSDQPTKPRKNAEWQIH